MKKGFTLAEILVTLGIVGVVAALTLPGLNVNVSQAKTGPFLSEFVSSFENAAIMMMQEEGTEDFIPDFKEFDFDTLSKYMKISPVATGTELAVYAPNGSKIGFTYKPTKYDACPNGYNADGKCKDNVTNSNSTLGILPSGAMMYMSLNDYAYGKNVPGYKGIVGFVVLDINGNQTKNFAGKDVFQFYIDNSGTLIPAGSELWKSKFKTNDKATCSLKSSDYEDGYACTGAIADNGWKAEY